ncbi:hypothetical protein BDD43_1682 [Mucilaginibacter gracilis]|uniref:Tetratricopeptide repeat protein n=1 Tax=Mucilaginibacter gracilis TaxID=423350 RepID=A0A495IXW6_9SPHI|nr:hypothetical protein [Mucilaginibacter gracilis]RKR81535.1 hypothetical protein BDD43_1682 [Mucilaginibacter gracilis]
MKVCRTPLIWCVSFISCFCAGIAIILACGPETDPYDYYVSFFHNNVQGQKEYKPFYFSSYQFVYDDKEPVSEAAVNADEWAAYLGKDVAAADVNRAMYQLSAGADSVLEDGYLKTGERLPDSLANNSFLKALQVRKNPIALKYYRFAKGVEKIANTGYDKWDPKPVDSAALVNAGNAAFKYAIAEKDKFIQLRYYYQAQRLLHFGGAYKEAANVYDKYIAPAATQSHIKGWALALKAGECRRLKDTVRAAYLFSKVFAQYPERRLQAYQNYKYINPGKAHVLALAETNAERAVLYAMDGFGSSAVNLEPLKKVYEYEPTSPMVGLLLVREVNKLEEQYLTPKLLNKNTRITSFYYAAQTGKTEAGQMDQMNQLSSFCKLLVTERKYADYNIGNLAGAYISWIKGDNANGFVYLRAMNSEVLSPAMNDEKQIIQLLLSGQNIQNINEVNEEQLLPALQWLDTKVKGEIPRTKATNFAFSDNQKFTHTASNFYDQVLAPAYLKQGDTVKAALALLKSPMGYHQQQFWVTNLHSLQIARIIRWRKTPPTTPYLNFLADQLGVLKPNYLYELLGTACLREHQYNRAIAAFKQVDANYLNREPPDYYKGDPFIDRINDYPKVLHYGKARGLNKLQFAQAMADLEQKIKTDAPNAPSYYYRYATGLYNASHYGNAPYLINWGWSADDFGRKDIYSYDADYIRTKNAEKYYLLARSLSSNEEFKAKCTFMAAKCLQKQFVMPDYNDPNYSKAEAEYMLQLRSNDYFTELKSKYKKTAIFKKAVGECSYLKDFVFANK